MLFSDDDLEFEELRGLIIMSACIVFLAFMFGWVVCDLDRRIDEMSKRVLIAIFKGDRREPEPVKPTPVTIEQEPTPLMVADDL